MYNVLQCSVCNVLTHCKKKAILRGSAKLKNMKIHSTMDNLQKYMLHATWYSSILEIAMEWKTIFASIQKVFCLIKKKRSVSNLMFTVHKKYSNAMLKGQYNEITVALKRGQKPCMVKVGFSLKSNIFCYNSISIFVFTFAFGSDLKIGIRA